MGNRSSVATIHVAFDNDAIVPDYPATGKVHLDIVQDIVSCTSVECRVVGSETTSVSFTRVSGDSTVTETEHQKRDFLNITFILQQNSSETMNKGQYEYPYEFTIPGDAPLSMKAKGAGDKGKVSYSMEVWLNRPGRMRWSIRHFMKLNVIKPSPRDTLTPLYFRPSAVPVSSMMKSIERGDIRIGAKAASDELTAGCRSAVKIAMENNSTVPVKAIEVSILEKVTIRANHFTGGPRPVKLFHVRFTPRELGLDLSPRTSQNVNNADQAQVLRTLRQKIETEDYKLNLFVPAHARCSHHGGFSLIHVTHTLEITAITSFGTENPTVSQELTIYSPKPANVRRAVVSSPTRRTVSTAVPTAVPSAPPASAPPAAVSTGVRSASLTVVYPSAGSYANNNTTTNNTTSSTTTVTGTSPTRTPSVKRFADFEQFSAALSQSCDPCGELEKYLRDGYKVDDFTPEQYYALFKAISYVYDQQCFAEALAAAATKITCAKVARALAGSKEMAKSEVAQNLLCAGPVLDKRENAHLVKAELTSIQFMTVQKYL